MLTCPLAHSLRRPITHSKALSLPPSPLSGFTHDGILRVLNGELCGTLFHPDARLWHVPPTGSARLAHARSMAVAARDASRRLQALSSEQRRGVLLRVAAALEEREKEIVEQNAHDVRQAEIAGVAPALLQRLKLKPGRVRRGGRDGERAAGCVERGAQC